MTRFVLTALLILASVAQQTGDTPLTVSFVDVEGGQATLIVAPSGQSLLIDTGFPGFEDRDLGRILAAAKQAGVSRIDYLVITHYHGDHVGNAAALAKKLPIGAFIDHGQPVEPSAKPLYDGYAAAWGSSRHVQARPGDKIPIAGLDVTVVASAGEHITTPVAGGGSANPLCAAFKPKDPETGENPQSVGLAIDYGKFRLIDLGDLTWNKEHDLVCPQNLLGTASVYLTTHHGTDSSGPPVIVHALRPRVAIMNNGATKGGSAEAWTTVKSSPGLEGLWQLHVATAGGKDHNVAEPFIANVDETTGYPLTLTAHRDGSFSVTNPRNQTTKSYK